MGSRLDTLTRRLDRFDIPVDLIAQAAHQLPPGPLLAPVCSHLGHDLRLQFAFCRTLHSSLRIASQQNASLLLAAGTAIDPWLRRVASLVGFDLQVLVFDRRELAKPANRTHVLDLTCAAELDRDSFIISIADIVDGLFVRKRGKIESCLVERLKHLPALRTRVASIEHPRSAAARLCQLGAEPILLDEQSVSHPRTSVIHGARAVNLCDDSWTRDGSRWLIHCTRGCHGNWPDETRDQFMTAMLLGDPAVLKRSAADALARIVNSGRLIASCRTSDHDYPVVCFTALSLQQVLRRRCYRPHLHRWDYQPFGIAIRLTAARRLGAQPAIYGPSEMRVSLQAEDRFRFQASGTTYDWREEHEWRVNGDLDLNPLDRDDVRLFAAGDADSLPESVVASRWPLTLLPASLKSPPQRRSRKPQKPI